MNILSIISKIFSSNSDKKRVENNQMKIESLKNIHEGGSCFIIGNGPSVRIEDLERLRNKITFCANRFFLAYPKMKFRPMYTCVADNQVIEDFGNEIIKKSSGIKIFFIDIKREKDFGLKGEHIEITRAEPRPFVFSTDPNKFISSGGTVTLASMQLAYYMGIKKIIVYGIDHNFVHEKASKDETDSWRNAKGEGNHFIKGYRSGKPWCLPDMSYINDSFNGCLEFAENNNLQILNATRGGKLEIFERVNFEDII